MITFSVVIPTHKGRPTIARAVASVLSQSYPHLELVVVCDGDGSRTRELLAGVVDSRLRIMEQPRSGVSTARNLGVSVAQHEWITFIDDDDSAREHWLASWVSAITEDTMVVTARLAFWEGERLVATRDCRLCPADPTLGASTILPGGFVVRRGVFQGVGGFDESLTYSENQELGLRLVDHLAAAGSAAIVTLPDIVVDFHREPATDRMRRYRSGPADAARVLLSRYEQRLAGDAPTRAAFLRIISRAERKEHRIRAAISTSFLACRLQPSGGANYRSLALALSAAPVGVAARVGTSLRGHSRNPSEVDP